MELGTTAHYKASSAVLPLFSLALQRLKYSHMYTTMGLTGILYSLRGTGMAPLDLLPALTITVTTTGLYILNDVFDIEIDKVSHPERALPKGLISRGQAATAAILLMVSGTVSALYVNWVSGVLVGFLAVFGVLYSVPPVRLRRFPVVPSATIGLFVFLAFLAGASFQGGELGGQLVLGGLILWAMFLCASMAKDLADIEGDRAEGVNSLPVVLGEELGFRVTSVVVYSAYIFPVLYILVFRLNPLFIVPSVFLFLFEIFALERYNRSRETAGLKWFGIAFMPFVAVQLLLLVASIL